MGGGRPPSGGAWEGRGFFSRPRSWIAFQKFLRSFGLSTSGVASPICETVWARIEPPRRFWPRPRSISRRTVSPIGDGSGATEGAEDAKTDGSDFASFEPFVAKL